MTVYPAIKGRADLVMGRVVPVHRTREQRRSRALASLRQAVWGASQFLDREQVERFVDDVLHEIASDEP